MSNDKKMGEKKKKPSMFKNYRAMNKRKRAFGAFKGIRTLFGLFLCFLFALFLMSGIINQRKTGTTLVNYALHIGQVISAELISLSEGKGLKYFTITEDGVYLKGVEVNDKDILDGTPLDIEEDNINNNNKNNNNNDSNNNDNNVKDNKVGDDKNENNN